MDFFTVGVPTCLWRAESGSAQHLASTISCFRLFPQLTDWQTDMTLLAVGFYCVDRGSNVAVGTGSQGFSVNMKTNAKGALRQRGAVTATQRLSESQKSAARPGISVGPRCPGSVWPPAHATPCCELCRNTAKSSATSTPQWPPGRRRRSPPASKRPGAPSLCQPPRRPAR